MAGRIAQSTAKKAHKVLDTIIKIAKDQRLAHGTYCIDPVACALDPRLNTTAKEIVEEYLTDVEPLCNGPLACLLGSALLGAGIDPIKDERLFNTLTGPAARADELAKHPRRYAGLKLALDSLDDEAKKITGEGWYDTDYAHHTSPGYQAEDYFEGYLPEQHDLKPNDLLDQQEVIKLARAAKRSINKQVVKA